MHVTIELNNVKNVNEELHRLRIIAGHLTKERAQFLRDLLEMRFELEKLELENLEQNEVNNDSHN